MMLLLLKHRMTNKSKCPCLIYQLSNPNDAFGTLRYYNL